MPEQGHPIADGEGKRDGRSLGQADAGETEQAGGQAATGFEQAVKATAEADAKQGQRQNDSETEYRPAEERSQHAVPHQLHQKECETHNPGREKHESRRRRGVFVAAFVGRLISADRRESARPDQGVERHAGREHGRAPQHPSRSESLKQNEIREQAADHSPERVQPVKYGQPAAAHVLVHLDRGHRGGHGPAHEQGGPAQHQSAEHDAQQAAAKKSQPCAASDFHVHGADQPQQQRRQGRKQRGAQFKHRVQPERTSRSISARAEQQSAGAKSPDEYRQHRGGRGRAGAEHQTKLAQPCHLVDQGRKPGREQQQSHAQGRHD
jgi:hypothetical protein